MWTRLISSVVVRSVHNYGVGSTAPTLRGLHLLAAAALAVGVTACDLATAPSDDGDSTATPTTPTTFAGRPVDVQGEIDVSSRNVVFNTWDSSQIDGDIVSLYVNGTPIVQNYTLTGAKRAIPFTLNKGYNYVLLYAHNEGSISPNTAAVSIVENGREQTLVLSADLRTNGAYNIRVP
jgi:hypothetical protein